MKDCCVLVTGAAGYIGSHTVPALLGAGYRVVAVDNLMTGRRAQVPKAARFVEADAGDGRRMAELLREERCEAILHLAGLADVTAAATRPLECYRTNACASRNLMQAAVDQGVDKFIYASSAAVYGDPAVLPVDESATTTPCSVYGRSKLTVENMLKDVASTGSLQFVALRYFNVAGSGPGVGPPAAEATHLIRVACEAACGRRESVTVFGDDYGTPDGTGVRDYVHVVDLAETHVLTLDYLFSGGTSIALNCGSGRGYSVREVLEEVCRISGSHLRIESATRRPGDIAAIRAATERTREVLGWTATCGLTEIIASVWAQEHRSSHDRLPLDPAGRPLESRRRPSGGTR